MFHENISYVILKTISNFNNITPTKTRSVTDMETSGIVRYSVLIGPDVLTVSHAVTHA